MSPDELAEMERLWRGRIPVKEIARRLGFSHSHVLCVAARDRDRFPYRRVQTPDEIRELWVLRIRAGRATVNDACIATGANPVTVRKWLREMR